MRHDGEAYAKRMRETGSRPLCQPARQGQQHIRPRNRDDERDRREAGDPQQAGKAKVQKKTV